MNDPKTSTTKPASPAAGNPTAPAVITLNDLCAELKLDRREARLVLRMAAKDTKTFPTLAESHRPRQPWEWEPATSAYAEARKALSMPITPKA